MNFYADSAQPNAKKSSLIKCQGLSLKVILDNEQELKKELEEMGRALSRTRFEQEWPIFVTE